MNFISCARIQDVFRSIECILNLLLLLSMILNECVVQETTSSPTQPASSTMKITITSTENPKDDVCTATNCRAVARQLSRNMIKEVDPCEDFSIHACGGWQESNNKLQEFDITNSTLELLRQPEKRGDIDVIRKTKKFFQVCENTDVINKKGLNPLIAFVNASGGWPLIIPEDERKPNNLSLQELHERYANETLEPALFDLIIGSNPDDIDEDQDSAFELVIADIHPEAGWDVEDRTENEVPYKNSKWLIKYHKYIRRVTKIMSTRRSSKNITRDIKSMIKFEAQLFKLYQKDLDSATAITIDEIQMIWDHAIGDKKELSINWLNVTERRLKQFGIKITLSTIVGVSPDTLRGLAKLMKNVSLTTIENYIHWRTIDGSLKYMDAATRRLEIKAKGTLFDMPHWKLEERVSCIPDGLKHPVALIFIRKFHKRRSTRIVKQMVKTLRTEIIRQITNSTWPVHKAKQLLKGWIGATKVSVGYPKFYNHPEKMIKKYKMLSVGSDYFRNVLALKRLVYIYKIDRLRIPEEVLNRRFQLQANEDNALYDPTLNIAYVPESQFLMPEFDPDLPLVWNYGRIGATTIGHEMSHAFNNLQYRFFENDTETIPSWFRSTAKEFKNREECFIKQFDSYGSKYDLLGNNEVYTIGNKTVDENIADHGGLKASFAAYERLKNTGKLPKTKKLPGFEEYSDEQLFFYSFASPWCESAMTTLSASDLDDEHSPNRLRIIGGVQNMKEFADAFNCPPNSPMNPQKKCALWD